MKEDDSYGSGMTVKAVCAEAVARLTPKYGAGEAKAMVRIIFENVKGWAPVDLALKSGEEVSSFIKGKVDDAVGRLLHDEPIQYIFGNARFYGMTFEVTPDTLIPRPETEELVDMIVKERGGIDDQRVLDAGTGSGCIAVALARNLPFSRVTAIDISPRALAVARSNAERLKVKVTFAEQDMLSMAVPAEPLYDVIVSNPPYIGESERATMEPNVVDHEPPTALFVPDNDPLRFYRALTRYAVGALSTGGAIYFEINPLHADELRQMMTAEGFDDVTLSRDMHGKMRFAVGRKGAQQ